jgi:hypothetical protein
LDKAMAKAADLSPIDEERIGQRLDAYIDDLQALRAMLDEGARSFEEGRGKEIDIEQIIARARANEV